EPRGAQAPPRDERASLPRAHSVLRPARDGPARDHGLVAGALRLRQQPRGGNGEDALRPVLHQARVALAGPEDPARHGEDRPPGSRILPPPAPRARSGAAGARARQPGGLTRWSAAPPGSLASSRTARGFPPGPGRPAGRRPRA